MTDHPLQSNEGHETLNTLLRNELAAVEAYEKAMSRLEDEHVLADLQTIRDDHANAADLLRGEVEDLGDDPPDSPGPWSTVCAAVAGTAGAISPTTAAVGLSARGRNTPSTSTRTHSNTTASPPSASRRSSSSSCRKTAGTSMISTG